MASIQKYREKTGGKINRNSPQKKCKVGFFRVSQGTARKKDSSLLVTALLKLRQRVCTGSLQAQGRTNGWTQVGAQVSARLSASTPLPPSMESEKPRQPREAHSPIWTLELWTAPSKAQSTLCVCVSEIERDSAGVGKCQLLGTVGDRGSDGRDELVLTTA